MVDVLDVVSRPGVKIKAAEALRATEADGGASLITVAVVREFDITPTTTGHRETARHRTR
jgi:hypothetical protein